MAFNLKLQMTGLCHFIENGEDDPAKRRLLVLLPDLRLDEEFGPKHQARIVYDSNQARPFPESRHTRLRSRSLIRERVTIRYRYADDTERTPRLTGNLEKTIALGEILAAADPDPRIAEEKPAETVAAQLLLDRGTLTEEGNGGEFEIPQAAGGAPATRTLPTHILVTEAGLQSVDLVISSLDSPEAEILTLEDPGNRGDVFLIFTADCELTEGEGGERPPLQEDKLDEDFAAHYRFLRPDQQLEVARLEARPAAGATTLTAIGPVQPDRSRLVPLRKAPRVDGAAVREGTMLAAPPPAEAGTAGVDAQLHEFGGHVRADRVGQLLQAPGNGGSDCQSCHGGKLRFDLERFLSRQPPKS